MEKIIIIVIIIFWSQGLRCHMLNMHKALCSQRTCGSTVVEPESAPLHKPVGAGLPPCADNLILESDGRGWGVGENSAVGERGKFQLSIYISISLLSILWQVVFSKEGCNDVIRPACWSTM